MKIITSVSEMKDWVRDFKGAVGFVPTMGFLHEGHLSLVQQSCIKNDATVVSIFVNPTQFGEGEDFEKYPRDKKKDCGMLEKEGVDVVFMPEVEGIYPDQVKGRIYAPPTISKEMSKLISCLCGLHRPGHFEGVIQVVKRFFEIIEPDRAYFGLKDYQQYLVVKQMVLELGLSVDVVGCPIVREVSGLAMSSRNVYLSDNEKNEASKISEVMLKVKDVYEGGVRDISFLEEKFMEYLGDISGFSLDYAVIRDARDLKEVSEYSIPYVVAVAGKFGDTRLIDNVILGKSVFLPSK